MSEAKDDSTGSAGYIITHVINVRLGDKVDAIHNMFPDLSDANDQEAHLKSLDIELHVIVKIIY